METFATHCQEDVHLSLERECFQVWSQLEVVVRGRGLPGQPVRGVASLGSLPLGHGAERRGAGRGTARHGRDEPREQP